MSQTKSSAERPHIVTSTTIKQISSQNSDLSQISSSITENGGDKLAAKKVHPSKAHVGLAKSPDLKNCKSKVGSLHNIKHTPAGGNVKIETQKLQWNAKSKVGSLDNKEHKPAGGNVRVESRKLEWNTTSKVQSLQNIKHKAGGGNVKIFNDLYRDKSINGKQVALSRKSDSSTSTKSNSNKSSSPVDRLNNNLKKMNL